MSTTQKIAVAFLLFAAWGALVTLDLAPPDQYVTALRDALVAIGVVHATVTTPGDRP